MAKRKALPSGSPFVRGWTLDRRLPRAARESSRKRWSDRGRLREHNRVETQRRSDGQHVRSNSWYQYAWRDTWSNHQYARRGTRWRYFRPCVRRSTGLLYSRASREFSGNRWPFRVEALARRSAYEESRSPSKNIFLEQSRGQSFLTVKIFQAPRQDRPLQAAGSVLPERDPGNACRHGPSREIALRARRGLGGCEEKANPDWRRALERLDRRRHVSLAGDDRHHKELHRVMPRKATATARVSPLRELASARNSATWHRAIFGGKMELLAEEPDVSARTVVTMIVKTPVTTAGGAGADLARTSRAPASAAPVTGLLLLRDPGGTIRVMTLDLAQISLDETADVASHRRSKIALPIPCLHPDHRAGTTACSSCKATASFVPHSIHYTAPNEPASEHFPCFCEISSRPCQGKELRLPPRAAATPTGAGASTTTAGKPGTSASVAPLPGILRDEDLADEE